MLEAVQTTRPPRRTSVGLDNRGRMRVEVEIASINTEETWVDNN